MKATRSPKSSRKPRLEVVAPVRPALPLGLHGGIVELRTKDGFRVRSMTGERFLAVLGDGVEIELAEECLRTARMVILCETVRGPTIVGALQTVRSIVRGSDGVLSLEARDIRLRADRKIVIQAGDVTLLLDENGRVRTTGERMVIDMSSNVKVLSALVELP